MSKYPDGWKIRSIGSLITEKKERLENDFAVPFSVSKVLGIVGQREKFKKRVASSDISKYKVIRKGDFAYDPMLLWDGSINRMNRNEIGAVSPAYVTFQIYSELLDSDYFLYFLKAETTKNFYKSISKGTNVRRQKAEFRDFAAGEFLLPPLPEQKKIAEILSMIDHVISTISKKKKKINLVLSQLLTESTTPQVSSAWSKTTIGNIVDFQGGSQPPRSKFRFAPEEGFIRMLQIRDYKSDSRATYIPLDLCRRFCDKEDVMIGRYGPPNFQILRGKEGSYNVALIKAIPKNENELKKEYLFRFLQRQDLFLLMDTLSQRTSGQQGLDMDALKEFPISLPDPSMQEHICKSLDAIESISLGLQHREKSLLHLKRAIANQLLSGLKRVNI